MSLEGQVDIFVDLTPEYPWLLFCQSKYLHFMLDTVSLHIDCILYLNLRQESQSQSEVLKHTLQELQWFWTLLSDQGILSTKKSNWLHGLESLEN